MAYFEIVVNGLARRHDNNQPLIYWVQAESFKAVKQAVDCCKRHILTIKPLPFAEMDTDEIDAVVPDDTLILAHLIQSASGHVQDGQIIDEIEDHLVRWDARSKQGVMTGETVSVMIVNLMTPAPVRQSVPTRQVAVS